MAEQEPATEHLIAWHKECAETHEDWAHWFRYKPSDQRVHTHGTPEHHEASAANHRASADRLRQLEQQVAEQRGVIDKLPLTADGVRVTPGMTVHFIDPETGRPNCMTCDMFKRPDINIERQGYSTEQAARAGEVG